MATMNILKNWRFHLPELKNRRILKKHLSGLRKKYGQHWMKQNNWPVLNYLR